jgi:hypothetical protein
VDAVNSWRLPVVGDNDASGGCIVSTSSLNQIHQ